MPRSQPVLIKTASESASDDKLLRRVLDKLDSLESKITKFQLQSADMPADAIQSNQVSDSGEETVQQTMEFSDANKGETKDFDPLLDSTFFNCHNSETEISNFLSRPVKIADISWTENTDISADLPIWFLYFNDERIKRKLDNYAFINCNLKLKIMINASPFYYGLAIVSYNPLPLFRDDDVGLLQDEIDFMQQSQRPHFYIYPQNNQGGEMTLPFIYYKDWINLTIGDEMIDVGSLNLRSIEGLRNANSVAGTDCTIQIYCWAENVKLAGNTAQLALQSQDEYEDVDGIISKPATAIARATGMLKDVPVIGPYMTASSMVAERIGKVASWFGFTDTPVIESSKAVTTQPLRCMASPEISTTVGKLTLDPKNELTVDSRVAGTDGTDHMDISKIVERESYLFNSTWDSTSTVETQICAVQVTPHLFRATSQANQDVIQYTPMGHVSNLFKYWRGDIIFRFQFIASQYHRGRVRITWDPVFATSNGSVTSTVAFNKIVDISETPNFEIRIPYQQDTSYLRCSKDLDNPVFIENDSFLNTDVGFSNGTLGVRVFTQLTSPVANAPALVYVSARAADNFEFATPTDPPQDVFVYEVQSQDECIERTEPHVIFESEDDPKINLVYMGETVRSLRTILRRATLSRVLPWFQVDTLSGFTANCAMPRLGYYAGFDPNGVQLAISPVDATEKRYNFVKTTPINWMRQCYIGNRGSVNWYVNTDGTSRNHESQVTIRRLNAGENLSLPIAANMTNLVYNGAEYGTILNFKDDQTVNSTHGVDVTNPTTFAGLTTGIPFYSRFRFHDNNALEASFGNDTVESRDDGMNFQINHYEYNNGTLDYLWHSTYFYQSIGSDFTFVYYLNVPVMYKYAKPTPANVQPGFPGLTPALAQDF